MESKFNSILLNYENGNRKDVAKSLQKPSKIQPLEFLQFMIDCEIEIEPTIVDVIRLLQMPK